MSPWQVGAFTGGSAFAAKAPRAASVRMVTKGARKNVVMMSAATDEIIEKLKTLTVRCGPPASYACMLSACAADPARRENVESRGHSNQLCSLTRCTAVVLALSADSPIAFQSTDTVLHLSAAPRGC